MSDGLKINLNSTVYVGVYYLGDSGGFPVTPEQLMLPNIRSVARADLTILGDEVSSLPVMMKGQDPIIRAAIGNIGKGDAGLFCYSPL